MVAGVILGLTLVGCGGQENYDDGASGSTTFETAVSAYGGASVDSVGESDPPPDLDSTSEEGGSTADGGSSSGGSGGSGSSTGAGSSGTAGSGSSSGPQGTGSTTE